MVQGGDWLDEEEAAAWLRVPVMAVREAVEAGQLPTLAIGSHVRISRDALIAMARDGAVAYAGGQVEASYADTETAMDQRKPSRHGGAVEHSNSGYGTVPRPAGCTWQTELSQSAPFDFRFPDGQLVHYDAACEGDIELHGKRMHVRVGAYEAGDDADQARMVTLLNGWPICEFRETADHSSWASLIRPDGRRTLSLGATPPALYARSTLMPYREAINKTGPGVPNATAVVIAHDDYRSAIHHAVGRWLGRNRYPVEPAREQ